MNEEGDIMRADFQHYLRAFPWAAIHPKSRIKKSCIVGAEFTARRFVGDHFRGKASRNLNSFLGG